MGNFNVVALPQFNVEYRGTDFYYKYALDMLPSNFWMHGIRTYYLLSITSRKV